MSSFLDEDGVSTTYSYVLMFALATIVFTSVMWTYSETAEQTRGRAIREELTAIGEHVAQTIADMSTAGVRSGHAERHLDLPSTVAGEPYTIELNGSRGRIILESDSGVTAHVSLNNVENGSNISGTIYSSSLQGSKQDISRGTAP